jgi:hypothetical protein
MKKMVHEYEKGGSVGKSRPASKKKAVKQAVAISLKKAGRSRSQTGNKKKPSASKKKTSKSQ